MDDHHSSTAPLYRRTRRWDKLFLPLLLALGALLLAIWGLPESAQLKQSSSLFPTWLHSITELFAMVRGKPVPMTVTATPFVPTRYHRG